MEITESARNAILNTMLKIGLNPKQIFIEIGVFEGNLGIAFTKEKNGKIIKHGDLTIIMSNLINNIFVDFGEVDGRKGLVFLER